MRYIGYFIDSFVFGLGWIWAAFDPERQAWHDKLARTYVVSVERAGVSLNEGVSVKSKRKKDEGEFADL
jgi:uncharacterized RDD family membrane protein YckC